MTNNISFTSNIRFVDRFNFAKIKQGTRIGYRHNEINILKAPEFYSEEIRTCTGGGLVNPQKEALGFHLWDDMTNKKEFDKIINSLFRFVKEPERALLVGSKELEKSPLSIEQFEKIKKIFLERIKNVTYFEKHKFSDSETNYFYNAQNDTWVLCSIYRKPNSLQTKTIKNVEDLQNCFEKIRIAKGDKLIIEGKEITKEKYPQLFAQIDE